MSTVPDFSDDLPVLHALGAGPARLLGYGGEARVYAQDERRVLRILHPGADIDSARARADLAAEISAGARHLPFATPQVEQVIEVAGRVVMIERRLPGTPLSKVLDSARGTEREALLAAHLGAAERICEIDLRRDFFGDLIAQPPVRRSTYRDYLSDRIAQTRCKSGPLAHLLTSDIAEALPDCETGALVHFDVFAGNVLIENGAVTAILDFGTTAMIADPRLELWSAVACFDAAITPNATDADRLFAQAWLAQRGLAKHYDAARRWVAAYWAFPHGDLKLMSWCQSVLE